MKEGCVCFNEIELIQKWWLSLEDKQMLESKDVSKDKKASITRHTRGGGGVFCGIAAQGDKPCGIFVYFVVDRIEACFLSLVFLCVFFLVLQLRTSGYILLRNYFHGLSNTGQIQIILFDPHFITPVTCFSEPFSDMFAPVQICPKHGSDFMVYKCRYCCSVAVFFCFGTTHFCNQCHNDFQHVIKIPKTSLPHCPAG